jgi:hypothetical protein
MICVLQETSVQCIVPHPPCQIKKQPALCKCRNSVLCPPHDRASGCITGMAKVTRLAKSFSLYTLFTRSVCWQLVVGNYIGALSIHDGP